MCRLRSPASMHQARDTSGKASLSMHLSDVSQCQLSVISCRQSLQLYILLSSGLLSLSAGQGIQAACHSERQCEILQYSSTHFASVLVSLLNLKVKGVGTSAASLMHMWQGVDPVCSKWLGEGASHPTRSSVRCTWAT